MRFQAYYLFWSAILFLIELYIAVYIRDDFIRPYLGDVLVVILVYSMVRTFFKISILRTAIGVLLFSFIIEILQYFQIVEILGLANNSWARVVIGTSFSGKDLIAYTVGFLILLAFERSIGIYKQEWRSIK